MMSVLFSARKQQNMFPLSMGSLISLISFTMEMGPKFQSDTTEILYGKLILKDLILFIEAIYDI